MPPFTLGDIAPSALSGTSASAGHPISLMPGQPSTLGQLLLGAPKEDENGKKKFWGKPGGQALGSLLGILALTGLGTGLGAAIGGRRGAARGATLGSLMGVQTDLGQRRAGSEAATNENKLYAQLQGERPTSQKEYQYYLGQASEGKGPQQQGEPLEAFLKRIGAMGFNDWKLQHEKASVAQPDEDIGVTMDKIMKFGESRGFLKPKTQPLVGGGFNLPPQTKENTIIIP